MKCEECKQYIENIAAGNLNDGLLQEYENHLFACAGCYDDWLKNGTLEYKPSDVLREEIFQSVIAVTNNNSCSECEQLLCDYAANTLDDIQRKLVSNHLDHCERCQNQLLALHFVDRTSPDLIFVAPKKDLVNDIVRLTTGKLNQRSRLCRRTADVIQKWIKRPRFSLEISYVLTCVWLILFGIPNVNSFSKFENLTLLRITKNQSAIVMKGVDLVQLGVKTSVDNMAKQVNKLERLNDVFAKLDSVEQANEE